MKQKIYEAFGIQLLEESGIYYMRYDGGEVAVIIKEIVLTSEEAELLRSLTSQASICDFLKSLYGQRMDNAKTILPTER